MSGSQKVVEDALTVAGTCGVWPTGCVGKRRGIGPLLSDHDGIAVHCEGVSRHSPDVRSRGYFTGPARHADPRIHRVQAPGLGVYAIVPKWSISRYPICSGKGGKRR